MPKRVKQIPPTRESRQPESICKKKSRGGVLGICIILVLIVVAVFGQTYRHEFVNFDDDDYVYDNPAVTAGLTWKGTAWAFTHVHSSNWHPVTWLSHMLDCQLYGLWPGGHHLTNVLLHAFAAVLLFLVLREMTGAMWRNAFVAAVFAIHPLHVESVAWVAERKDLLSGIFFMLTLGAYVRYTRCTSRTAIHYLCVLLFFALGLMSKPMLVTLPFVLLLLDYWPLGRIRDAKFNTSNLQSVFVEKLPLFALSAASCVVTVLAQTSAIQPWERLPFLERVGNSLVAYGIYFAKTIFPGNLAVYYPLVEGGWPLWQVGAALLLIGTLTLWAVLGRCERPYLLTGWFWFIGMLVPVIGLLHVGGQAYADRYTYLPQIGLCIAGAWLVGDWAGTSRWRRAGVGWVAATVLCTLMVVSIIQTSVWRDSAALWKHTLAATRKNEVVHNNLGQTLKQQGKIEEGMLQFREALKINPGNVEAHNNIGGILFEQGRVDEALVHFQQALKIAPGLAKVRSNLGNALLSQGKTDEAIAEFLKALQINPALSYTRCFLGNALLQQGKTQEAINEYLESLRLDREYAEAHNNLAIAMFQQGRSEEAIASFREAVRLKPGYADAYENLGNVLRKLGRMDEAVEPLQKALDLHPGNAGD